MREAAHAAQEQGIAVRIGGGRDLAAQHAARSAAVVHDHLLSQRLGEALPDGAGEDVVTPARAETAR